MLRRESQKGLLCMTVVVLFPRTDEGQRGYVTLVTRWFDDLQQLAVPRSR